MAPTWARGMRRAQLALVALAAAASALQEPHDKFRSRLRSGMRGVEQRESAADALDQLSAVLQPPGLPPARQQRPPPPPPPQLDVCAEDYDGFDCDDSVPCIHQCTGCSDASCWLRCYQKCDRAKHQDFVGKQCAERCAEQHTQCTADCEVEAASIAATAPRNATATATTANGTAASAAAAAAAAAAASKHCGDGSDGAYPFDCAVPCLEQCDACASTSQCLPRCFHQCMQGSHCTYATPPAPRSSNASTSRSARCRALSPCSRLCPIGRSHTPTPHPPEQEGL